MKENTSLIRLQKFLAHAGVCSRRKAEKFIQEGRVQVDGKIIKELGTKIDPKKQQITVDGKPVRIEKRYYYFLLNKPAGFLTTLKDPFGRPTIKTFLKNITQRVYPVGRLDKDSEGLLLLTNHGELAYRLLHPRYKVKKVYIVTVSGTPSNEQIEKISKGIKIRGGVTTNPCTIKLLKREKKSSVFEVVLREGRKRQIRYMFRAIGYRVVRLIRIRIGPLEIGNLKPGYLRSLTKKELRALFQEVSLNA